MSVKFGCKDFDEGYFKLNNSLFFNNSYDFQRGGVTAHKFDVTMNSESPKCTLQLANLNYTDNKWKMLCNLYLDTNELGVMIARLNHYKSQKKHKDYVPDIAMQFKSRRNVSGACLLSMSLGYNQGAWRCFITTRASELTCRWPMDLIFVHVLLKLICNYLLIDFEEVKISWHMISTYQSITSMPLFVVLAGREDFFKEEPQTSWQRFTKRRYEKSFTGDEYSSYAVQRRPMEAYRILKGEIQPKRTTPTDKLKIEMLPDDTTFSVEEDFEDREMVEIDLNFIENLTKRVIELDLFGKGGYR